MKTADTVEMAIAINAFKRMCVHNENGTICHNPHTLISTSNCVCSNCDDLEQFVYYYKQESIKLLKTLSK